LSKGKVKRKGRSVQDLLGIKTFTKLGLHVGKDELVFFSVQPINISVLSHENIEIKIRHLMMVLSAVPDIEISCTDSSECFDSNKAYINERIEDEQNDKIKKLLKKDYEFLDEIQSDTATARQFVFVVRCKGTKYEQNRTVANRVEKIISEQGFDIDRLDKSKIKRFLAIYLGASKNGENINDYDGLQYVKDDKNE
jgi:hypothetical protein